jgi:PAS domain S-box-containing protein
MEADLHARHRASKAPRQAEKPVSRPRALMKERSEILGRLWEMSSEGIFVVRNGRVRECNHFLAARAGYAMDEVEGTCFASFFDRGSIPAVEAACGQIALGRGMVSLPQVVLVCKNGKRLEVQMKACACRFGGKPAALVALIPMDRQISDDSWEADLESFFVSEKTPFTLPQVI